MEEGNNTHAMCCLAILLWTSESGGENGPRRALELFGQIEDGGISAAVHML